MILQAQAPTRTLVHPYSNRRTQCPLLAHQTPIRLPHPRRMLANSDMTTILRSHHACTMVAQGVFQRRLMGVSETFLSVHVYNSTMPGLPKTTIEGVTLQRVIGLHRC